MVLFAGSREIHNCWIEFPLDLNPSGFFSCDNLFKRLSFEVQFVCKKLNEKEKTK